MDREVVLPQTETMPSLVALLQQRAALTPTRVIYRFLASDDRAAQAFTYAEIDQRARAIGAYLQALGATGERVLLLYPFGVDFITGFFGCLYAGAVAVPLYPPRQHRLDDRLLTVAADAQATFALTTEKILASLATRKGTTATIQELQWLATDTITASSAADWQEPTITPATLAFLQYTSGSTGTPKGVMVSHANVLHNSALIHRAFAVTPAARGLMWTPFYHDMGLIGGVIQPIYGDISTTLLAPVDFLQQPSRWLQTISAERTVISGGPNFAYELCIHKITPEQCVGLDLSSWRVAFCGAEPVRADTLERFAAKFAPYGFRWETFTPCMGMAESTLLVSSTAQTQAPVIVACDAAALADHRVELLPPSALATTATSRSQRLVSSGRAWLDQRFRIVNPETCVPCAAHEVGEIWIDGPSVASGYWQRPAESAQTFAGYLADSNEGPFLRSGDLGFTHAGELFVTGRLKDLIIIRGRNYYPQDIELTAEHAHAALQIGCNAAFTLEADNEEKLVIVQEVNRSHLRTLPFAEVITEIRNAVAQVHEVEVYAIVLLRPGRLLKTSSGKVQRQANRQAYLQGELDAVGSWQLFPSSTLTATAFGVEGPLTPPSMIDHTAIAHWLTQQLARRLGRDPRTIDLDKPFAEYGLDSMATVELVQALDLWLRQAGSHRALTITDLWDFPTITALTSYLAQKTDEGKDVIPPTTPLPNPTETAAAASPPTTAAPAQSPATDPPTNPAVDELAYELSQLTRLLRR